MAKVAPEVKSRLLADGTWKDFTALRKNLQLSGKSPLEATREAVRQFCPDLSGVKPPPHRKKAAAEATETEPERKVVYPDTSVVSAARNAAARLLVSPETFAGKSCAKAKAVDWVIESMAFDPSMVSPSEAPSALAWSVYLMCQKSPVFAADLFTKYLVKNSKDEADTGDAASFDGAAEYDVAGAILDAQGGGDA